MLLKLALFYGPGPLSSREKEGSSSPEIKQKGHPPTLLRVLHHEVGRPPLGPTSMNKNLYKSPAFTSCLDKTSPCERSGRLYIQGIAASIFSGCQIRTHFYHFYVSDYSPTKCERLPSKSVNSYPPPERPGTLDPLSGDNLSRQSLDQFRGKRGVINGTQKKGAAMQPELVEKKSWCMDARKGCQSRTKRADTQTRCPNAPGARHLRRGRPLLYQHWHPLKMCILCVCTAGNSHPRLPNVV